MAGTVFKGDTFYRALTENGRVAKGEFVRCSGVQKQGPRLFAILHLDDCVISHQVSRNHIGSGSWEELNEMEVLGLAQVLPLD